MDGLVTVDGLPSRPAHQVQAGQHVQVKVPKSEPFLLAAAGLPLDLEYEDDDVLVVNKPAGLVVHPGAGHKVDTLANALIALHPALERVGGHLRAGIVHRLDKDTSGLLMVAKNEEAHAHLSAQFQNRRISKAYLALVHGSVTPDEAIVEARLGRDPRNRQRMALIDSGREATTHYRVNTRDEHYSLLDVRTTTGRTHQIRVHLAALGHPLAGDCIYGGPPSSLDRHFLHAYLLGFKLPSTDAYIELRNDLPENLLTFLESLTPVNS